MPRCKGPPPSPAGVLGASLLCWSKFEPRTERVRGVASPLDTLLDQSILTLYLRRLGTVWSQPSQANQTLIYQPQDRHLGQTTLTINPLQPSEHGSIASSYSACSCSVVACFDFSLSGTLASPGKHT